MNIKIGDTLVCVIHGVRYESKIENIEIVERAGEKNGIPVPVVGIETVKANKAVFDLKNGKFAYSDQVLEINGEYIWK